MSAEVGRSTFLKRDITTAKFVEFSFLIMLITAIILGFNMFKALPEDSLFRMLDSVELHFNSNALEKITAKDIFKIVLRAAAFDIVCFFAAFVFSFSALKIFVSGAVISLQGLKVGFSISDVRLAYISNGHDSAGVAKIIVFILIKLAVVYISFRFVLSLLRHSACLHKNSNYRFNGNLLMLFLLALISVAVVIGLHYIYCVFLFNL